MLNIVNNKITDAFEVEPQPFRRRLSREELSTLRDITRMAFDATIDLDVIEKIMNFCVQTERYMKGRAAGHIEDLVIRYIFRYYASLLQLQADPNYCHIEIGVLFGAATIFAHHATRLAGKTYPIVVVEPFEGYYGQQLDPNSKLPVNQEIFYENLDRFKIPHDDIILVKGLSTDPAVMDRCSKWKILSLLIDGDHSYAGVKNDWMYYSQFVIPGGFVLIDDYNNRSWSDINRFVNEELLPNLNGEWVVSLAYGRSIVLKKTTKEAAGKSRQDGTQVGAVMDLERRLQALTRDHEKLERDSQKSIALLETKIKQLQENLGTAHGKVAEAQARAKDLQTAMTGLQNKNRALEEESKTSAKKYADRVTQLTEAARSDLAKERERAEKVVGELQTQVQNAERRHREQVRKLESEIRAEKERYLRTRNELRNVVNSLSWKLISPLRKIKNIVFPGWRAK